MTFFGLLDVAIGIFFIYLLLSLVCTALMEIIESFLKKRASDLEQGIRELLGSENTSVSAEKLYDHPLVRALYKGGYADAKNKKQLPAYIPSRNFALALMDLVLPASDRNASSGAAGAVAPPAQPNATPQVVVLTDASQSNVALASLLQQQTTSAPQSLEPLRNAAAQLQNQQVKEALLPLIDAAANDANRARKNIEAWYDSSMDRVSGWYKRRTQQILLGLAFVIAFALNVDTIAITRNLASDAALRESLVAVAQTYAATNPTPDASPVPDPQSPISSCRRDTNSSACRVEQNLTQVAALGVPIGWDLNNPRSVPSSAEWPGMLIFLAWLLKALGWVVTALEAV